ncbi:MAG: hypothetical protein EAZ13_01050 [Sphingobacteriia bacterium]|nr:MAG: hypothetical protein EAZ13_01050 [Sphingobacteriia bacterium]
MNKLSLLFLAFIATNSFAQKQKIVITEDIPNFWNAYDQIKQTKDSLQQIELIKTLFINKGTQGLAAIMEVKEYTPISYINAINQYPDFWNSIRNNTLKVNGYAYEIETGIKQLKRIYPALKPAKIYFTIGALWSNGTTLGDKVLIGSELAMANVKVITKEIEKDFPHLPIYFNTNPIDNLTFLNTHEYIHTQQKTTVGNSLLAQTVLEGAAEFIAEIALKIKSPNPQIQFGKSHTNQLKKAFEKEMFSPYLYNWIWNNANNPFKMRDLAYCIGYAICEKYYIESSNKKLAIQEMIELDYNKETALIDFVEKANFFEKPLSFYKTQFEHERPKLVGIKQFENGSQIVDPATKIITLYFSQPMNINTRGFEFGPLGENNILMVKKVLGFSEDKKSFSFEVQLEPQKRYQSIISERFRDTSGLPLKAFLIDFKTKE